MSHYVQRAAWGCTVVMLLTACVSRIVWSDEPEIDPEIADDDYALMQVFVETFQQIDRNYVKDVDRRHLVEAAVRGMLSELDPYSNYIGPEDLGEFNEDVEQEFGGVGIQVSYDQESGQIVVMSPLPGGPAIEAGVLAGDRIVEIEGEQVSDFPQGRGRLDKAVKMLKGKPGVEVTIGVTHLGSNEIERITITRDIIQLQTVLGDRQNSDGTWDYLLDDESRIGYIRISHFSRRTTDELQAALRKLKDEGMKGLILDLRFNPGGLLTSAVEVTDLFVDDGTIVSTEGRNSPGRTWTAKRFGTHKGFPIAVLVNRFSASASEIVSAALQDHKRAVVVGERTWGKGSVQNVIEIGEGESALKLTTASYHRPSGKNIHRFPDSKQEDEWGVVPDPGFEVKFNDEQMIKLNRSQQNRGVLTEEEAKELEFEDTQLSKALEYINSQLKPVAEQPAEEAKPEPAEKSKDAASVKPVFQSQPPSAAA